MPWVIALLVIFLIFVPVAMLLFASFRGPIGALPIQTRAYFTFDHYIDVLFRTATLRMAFETTTYLSFSLIVSMFFGTTLAWLTERISIPKPNIFAALFVLPFLLPPKLITGSWMDLFSSRSGSVNVFIREHIFLFENFTSGPIHTSNLMAMGLGQGLFLTPITFLIMAAAFRNMGNSFEEASFASGAGLSRTMRSITLPLLLPALFTAMILGVWFTLNWTDVPFDLGAVGEVRLFSIKLYFQTIGSVGGFPNYGGAAAHGVLVFILLSVLLIAFSKKSGNWRRYAVIDGSNARHPRSAIGVWGVLLISLATFYSIATWGMPLYWLFNALIAGGVEPFHVVLTTERFWAITFNSLLIAMGSATLGTIIVVGVAWVVLRSNSKILKTPLDLLTTMPLVLPGQLVALAFMLAFLVLDFLPLWGTHLGLVVAFTFRLAIPYRLCNANLQQISRVLDEASYVSGGNLFATFRYILIPMLLPAIVAAWTIFFIFAFREKNIVEYVGYGVRTFTTMGKLSGEAGWFAVATFLSILIMLSALILVRYVFLKLSLRSGDWRRGT